MTNDEGTGLTAGSPQRFALTYSLGKKLTVAVATAVAVATVLVIPDAISMLPNAATPGPFFVRLLGLWLSVVVQWFLSFLGILSLADLINRGIIVDEQGIQLSRFSKRISWNQIRAVSSESRPFFSKLISRTQEYRVHIFIDGKPNRKGKRNLAAKQIDSFLFAQDEFKALFEMVCTKSFGFAPDGLAVVITERCDERGTQTEQQLRKSYNGIARKQKLITAYVAIMLVAFLGRNCARNYTFNEAANAFNRQDYVAAKHYCETALTFDPTFPYAWDRLARAEFRMKDLVAAEVHWHRALRMKPDLVSAKVGLSNICMQRKQYDAASKLLQTAIRLEEANIPALLNLVELNVLQGKRREAVSCCELALKLAPRDTRVRLVAAQTFMRNGNVERAANLLELVAKDDHSARESVLFQLVSEQLTTLIMAKVECK